MFDNGVNIDLFDKNGRIFLSVFCFLKNECIVELLLEKGVKVVLCDFFGWNVLYYVFMVGFDKIINMLLEKRVEIN